MELSNFESLRPRLFHTTARANLDRIRSERRLLSTGCLVQRAIILPAFGLRDRREHSEQVQLPGGPIRVRDHRPLHRGHIAFDEGWDLSRLVEHLNTFVFFWPGTANGPIESGRRHAKRYLDAGEELAFLCVPTASLPLAALGMFSSVNSGSPRCSNGRKSARGASTFAPLDSFLGTLSDVIEVVFTDSIELPDTTQWSTSMDRDWRSL